MKTFILTISIAILVLSGCSERITSVGVSLLPPKDGLAIDSIEIPASSATTYLQRIVSVSSTLLLGRSENLEGRLLLQFATIPTGQQSMVVDSAVLKMHVTYLFHDTVGTLAFGVHKMLRSWSESVLNWDSLNIAGTFKATPETTALFTVTPQDSFLYLRIDPIVRAWFAADTDRFGLVLIPSIGSTIVAGISTAVDSLGNSQPALTISAHDTSDSSTTATYYPYQRSAVADGNVPSAGALQFIQSGIAYRSKITFDVSALPRTVSITSAHLRLHLDTLSSLRNKYTLNELIIHYAVTNETSPSLSALTSVAQLTDSTGVLFDADVKALVQQWTVGTPNYGFVIRGLGESLTLDRYAIRGPTAPSNERPLLKIYYTILP